MGIYFKSKNWKIVQGVLEYLIPFEIQIYKVWPKLVNCDSNKM